MKTETSLYPYLLPLVPALESNKDDIVTNWMRDPLLVKIFKQHRISITKFTLNYAPDIVTYFIDVILGTQKIGDCPIMSKFVNYMLHKNIVPHEVYDICTRLRKVISAYILEHEQTENYIFLLDEIAIIFDANLSGVLRLFSDFLKKQSQTIEKSLEYKKKFQNISRVIDALEVNVFIVQSGRVVLGNKYFFKTLGVNDLEDLYLKFHDGLSFLSDVHFKTELFDTTTYESWIEALVENNEEVSVSIFNPNLREKGIYTLFVEMLPKSEPSKYVFTLKESSVFDEKENFVSKIDELTGLHSYAAFKDILNDMHESFDKEQRALVVIEASGLRKINEEFGFEKGDRHLIEIAQTIKEITHSSKPSARVGGNLFSIGLHFDTKQKSYDWAVHLRYELEKISDSIKVALSFYEYANSNQTELHAYELLHNTYSGEKKHVLCDSKEIDQYDLLEDQDMFITQFKKIQGIYEGLLLFKEIVVKSNNKVVSVSDTTLYLEVSQKQLAVAQIGMPFFIHCKTMGYIRAKIMSINSEKSTLGLQRFVFDEHTPFKRKMIRVVADKTLVVELIDEDAPIESEIIYLNEEYISFFISRKKALNRGKLVYMDLMLDEKYIELHGSVFSLEKNDEGFVCVIHFHHTTQTSNLIRQYIARRQLETIKELNAL